jgi:hypothetical protein
MQQDAFDKLKKYVDQELKITEENILDKSIQISNLYNQFLKLYNKELFDFKNKLLEKDKIYGELYHHYKFKFDYNLDTKSEIDNYIRSDEKYYQMALECVKLEVQVKFLEQILENINNLGYRIKNYIDLMKFKKGVF